VLTVPVAPVILANSTTSAAPDANAAPATLDVCTDPNVFDASDAPVIPAVCTDPNAPDANAAPATLDVCTDPNAPDANVASVACAAPVAPSNPAVHYDAALLQDILQWDVATWKQAIYYWDTILAQHGILAKQNDATALKAIDLGARDGGLSLWLAQKGIDVICSDFGGPTTAARALHEHYNVAARVEYRDINATAIDCATASFDIVVFKSILGGIGTHHNLAAIEQAVVEIQRILKPGGLMLFADNILGSPFHQFARRHFVPWGKDWHYLPLAELDHLLSGFAQSVTRSYGFFSCIKKDFAPFIFADKLMCKKSLSANYYMAYGYAMTNTEKPFARQQKGTP
jgi:SAM-dependent methyltransferase